MAKSIKVALDLDTTGFNQGIKDANSSLDGFEAKGKSTSGALKGAFAALAGAFAVKEIIAFGDEFIGLQNKLKAVTSTSAEVTSAFGLISSIANETRSGLTDVGDLFTKLTIATSEMGATQKDVAQLTSTFSKALKLSGTDAAGASSAILQFGQAMASGKLQGDEFKSLMETSPVFMRKLSEALDRPIGDLKELASQGLLTADVILAATNEMAASVDEGFGQTVPTVSEAFVVLTNKVSEMFGKFEENTGLFATIAGGLITLSENLDKVGIAMSFAFGAAVAVGVYNLVKAFQAFNAVGAITNILATARNALMGPAGWAAIAAGVAATAAAVVAMNEIMGEELDTEVAIAEAEKKRAEAAAAEDSAEASRSENRTSRQILEQNQIDELAEKKAKEEEKEAKRAEKAEERAALKAQRDEERAAKEEERKAEAAKRAEERHAKEMFRAEEVIAQAQIKAENDLADINSTIEKIGLTDTQIAQLETTNELNRTRAEKLAEIAGFNITDEEKNRLQEELNALYDDQIEKQTTAIALTDEQQRKFSTGWKEAWTDYKDAANDNAKIASDMFATVTQGMEDAFVDFVMTGKLSFKDLISDMIKQLLRIVAKKIFIKIIDILTGGMGSIFEGFFDKGGYISSGGVGIVGEKGPELVRGPAFVTGREETASILGSSGTGTVVYNINAVDAMSFKQLLSREPELIYNLTVKGGRSLP